MRNAIFILVILITSCRQQETDKVETWQSELELSEEDYFAGLECVYRKTEKQPESTFPFNKSGKIELVSYDSRTDSYNDELIKNGKFLVSNIRQRETLGNIQRDSLFAILYNFNYKRKFDAGRAPADCGYDPHNSILFYEKGKVIAFFEICFICTDTRQTKDVDFGQLCEEKNCMLQRFFTANKVDVGTNEEECQWKDQQRQQLSQR